MSDDALQRRRGPYAKSAVQRDRIVAVARDYFGKHGYRAATMRDIAREVGLSQAGLLHHFPTKSGLLTAVFDEVDRANFAEADRAGLQGASPIDQLTSNMAMRAANPELVRLIVTVAAEAGDEAHPAHQYFEHRFRHLSGLVAERLRAAQARGEVRPDLDPDQAGRLVNAAFLGLQIQWLIDPSIDLVALFRTFLESHLGAPTLPTTQPREVLHAVKGTS